MPTVLINPVAAWSVLESVQVNPKVAWADLAAVLLNPKASWAIAPPWLETPVCDPLPWDSAVFLKVSVDYLVSGGARVSWNYDPNFFDPLPWIAVLQASQGGVPTADDWVTVGTPQENVTFLMDPTQRMYGKTATLHYRVQLTTPRGTYYSPVANVLGDMDPHGWFLAREIWRKEFLRHRLFASVPGWLLKARRYGTICSCVDANTGEITNANDPNCFGTGWVGGYFPPVPCTYAELSPESTREERDYQGNTGMVSKVVVTGRFLGFPELVQGDAFVAQGSDARYYVHKVSVIAHWRGVPIALEAELRRAPYSDILYKVPITSNS